MRRLRALAIGLGVVLGLAVPVAGAPGSAGGPLLACAADIAPRAVLVVDDGARVLRLCVALDATTVSGIRLVELAASQHGLSYSLGFGKQAVCQLEGVGPTGGDCFASYPDFWGYWHGNGSGGWTWASGGAATFRVGNGDVEGWVWGAGDSGSTHRAPPPTRADDVCPPAPPPEPSPSRDPEPRDDAPAGGTADDDGGDGGDGSATSTQPSASSSPATEGEPKRDREDDRARDRATASVSPRPTALPTDDAGDLRATGASVPRDGGGPAPGLLAAAALGLALGGAAWWRTRQRRAGSAP